MTGAFEPFRDYFDEMYAVVRIAEVVVHRVTYRVEIIENYSDNRGGLQYTARYYVEEGVTLRRTYRRADEATDPEPESYRVWVKFDAPWVDQEGLDAEGALRSALGFLKQRLG